MCESLSRSGWLNSFPVRPSPLISYLSKLKLTAVLIVPKVIEQDDEPTQPQENLTTHAAAVLQPELGHDKDGLPLLPDVDAEEISMKDVKRLLAEYVRLSWSTCFKHEYYCCFVSNPHLSCIIAS